METKLEENRLSLKNLALVFGLAALVIGGGLSLIACGDPDGLEWSIERLTGSTEVENASTTKIHELSEKITEHTAILPDYDFKGEEEEQPAEQAAEGAAAQAAEAEEEGGCLGTTVSGLVGCIICALVLVGIAWIITKHANKQQQNPDLEQSA
jgi:cobalt/nickel transport system permease protein